MHDMCKKCYIRIFVIITYTCLECFNPITYNHLRTCFQIKPNYDINVIKLIKNIRECDNIDA